ncbi:MAG: hypothetical protein PHQ27_05680 [Victivallales bacterium]|nr:hypothetical protein [Victivallales bacterium]
MKLNKLELFLTVVVAALIGGPITYRAYQLYHSYSPATISPPVTVQVVPTAPEDLSLIRYAVTNRNNRRKDDQDEAETAIPTVIDFKNRRPAQLTLYDISTSLSRNNELISIVPEKIEPLYSFRDNILLFRSPDPALQTPDTP